MTTRCIGAAATLLVLALSGCGGADAPPLSPQAIAAASAPMLGDPPSAPTPDEVRSMPRAGSVPRAQAPANGGYSVDTSSREQVRLFYNTVSASSEGASSAWSGNIAGCSSGTTGDDFKAAILRRVNWYRAMAGVPGTVQFDATFNAKAQQAALYMAANQLLTHTPTSGLCFNATVAEAAGKSNLNIGSDGVSAIDTYMRDPGASNTAAGHRRWVLYPQTQLMGTGDIDASPFTNALWVMDGNYGTTRPSVRDGFVAWPNKGYVPYTRVYGRWSFSYPGAIFAGATVTMTVNGAPLPVTTHTVVNGYGENTIVWIPQGASDGAAWPKPSSDTTYGVTISGITGAPQASYSYDVIVFDPSQPSVSDGPLAVSGSGTANVGVPTTFSVAPLAGATTYQWRTLTTSPYTATDGAESGIANFTATTAGGYDMVTTSTHATGSASFRLAHPTAADEVLKLNQPLAAGVNASVEFASRLGAATTSEYALVEVSTDDGRSWTSVDSQQGTGFPGQGGFSTRTVSLAAYAGRTLQVRFRYKVDYSNNTGYYRASSGSTTGWFIDDVHTTNMSAVAEVTREAGSTSYQFTPSAAGNVLVQARGGMFGYYADWGLTQAVSVGTATIDPNDCLFDWAESTTGSLLAPHASSTTALGFYFRFYPASGMYIAVAKTDVPSFGAVQGHVYYYLSGVLHDLGTTATWYATAGCH